MNNVRKYKIRYMKAKRRSETYKLYERFGLDMKEITVDVFLKILDEDDKKYSMIK